MSNPFSPPPTTTTDDAAAETTRTSSSIRTTFKAQSALESLSSIIPNIPDSANPSLTLLNDPDITSQISSLLRQSDAGAGDDNICRWLYDTFQSADPHLQLVVLRFLPIIAGVYLSRVTLRKPLAGFEAVLLALYAHETTARDGQSITVSIPDLSHPSIYHESKSPMVNNTATELNLAVISPILEPYGTVRSTKRARIVGIALELYYSRVWQMPVDSKKEFCGFCEAWAGGSEEACEVSRIGLSWELLQPILRILGHCLLGPCQGVKEKRDVKLFEAALSACRSLNKRCLIDVNAKAILATESLLNLARLNLEADNDYDYTEIRMTNVISI